MDFASFWELLTKIMLPILFAYGGYLQMRLTKIESKLDEAKDRQHDFEVHAAREFVTQPTLITFDRKVTDMLNRIDDKLTKMMEERR